MIKSELTCIGCPLGCSLLVTKEENKVLNIAGYACNRGREYGFRESTNPTRTLTTTIEIREGDVKLLSVKTDKEIPKNLIFEGIKALKNIRAYAPIHMNEIVVNNFLETGVNIIATKEVKKICNNYNL